MLILVLGKNGSGKSAFAERLAVRLKKTRYYLATMLPHGKEGEVRVQKHIAQREGLGFVTLELPYTVGAADVPKDAVALLEDCSNLLANAMFACDKTQEQVLKDIEILCRRVDYVVAVSISAFEDGAYNEETQRYIRALHWLNNALYALADIVFELDAGNPTLRKGEWIEST